MLADAIGKMFPVIVAIMLTPFQIVALVMVLGGPNRRAGGPAFVLGWLAALCAVTTVAIIVVESLSQDTHRPIVHVLQLGIGLLLLGAALHLWSTRPKDGIEPPQPKWLSSIGDARALRAGLFGAALCVTNPKIVALVFAGMSSLAYLSLSRREVAVAAAFFVLTASSPVIALVLASMLGGEGARARIQTLKQFFLRYNNVILMVIMTILGMSVIGSGISGLGQRLD